jgi:hypothetical protein
LTAIDLKVIFDSLGVTPLQHYIVWGASEGIAVTSVPAGEQVANPMLAGDLALHQTEIKLAGVMVSSDHDLGWSV